MEHMRLCQQSFHGTREDEDILFFPQADKVNLQGFDEQARINQAELI